MTIRTMRIAWAGSAIFLALAGCTATTVSGSRSGQADAGAGNGIASPAVGNAVADETLRRPASGQTSIVRLDCGSVAVDDFSKRFSDQQIYPHGPKRLTDSCYVITHNGQRMLWDTGLPAALLNTSQTKDGLTASLDRTIVEQLTTLGLTPADIAVVGISHMHFDHTGQAAAFPGARLIIGAADLEGSKGKDDPFGPWRRDGAKVTASDGDVDVFGDGDVVALFLPGHTPGHHALLVKLKSGNVLLSGDTYHATEARAKRGAPPFNTDRAETLRSMDRFEALAKALHAKVVIQHEAGDIAKLPTFPEAAQ